MPALRLFYIGAGYHGFQIQPGIKTVAGEIYKSLKKQNIRSQLYFSSRTDAGVNAFSQVIFFSCDNLNINAFNYNLPKDIWAWAICDIDRFNPRNAKFKEYIYIYPGKISISQDILNIFKGFHDFSSFSTPDKRCPRIYLEDIQVFSISNSATIFYLKAPYFLYHMVRKIVSALLMVHHGRISVDDIKDSLDGKKYLKIPAASPENLFLYDITYSKKLDWKIIEYSLDEIEKLMEDRIKYYREGFLLYDSGSSMFRSLVEADKAVDFPR